MLKKVFLILTVANLTSCVSKGEYQNTLDAKLNLEADLKTTQEQLAQCRKELEKFRDQVGQMEDQSRNLRDTNQILAQKNSTLAQEVIQGRSEQLKKTKEMEQKEKAITYASETYDDLVKSLKAEVQAGKVKIENMRSKISVSLVDRLSYPVTVSLSDEIKAQLDKLVPTLKNTKERQILIQSHSEKSAVPEKLRERYPSQWELSARRAAEVVRYLESKGVPGNLLVAAGLGSHRPIGSNKTPTGRTTNRRIEIVLIPNFDLEMDGNLQ